MIYQPQFLIKKVMLLFFLDQKRLLKENPSNSKKAPRSKVINVESKLRKLKHILHSKKALIVLDDLDR